MQPFLKFILNFALDNILFLDMPKGVYNKNFINSNTGYSRSTYYRKFKNKKNNKLIIDDEFEINFNEPNIDNVNLINNSSDDNNNFDDNYNNCEDINYINEIISDEEISNDLNKIDNEKDMIIALICLYFSGKFTQTSFNIILEFLQISSKFQIPKTFNQLVDQFFSMSNNQIRFAKESYCSKCNLKKTEGLKCNNCNLKYVQFLNLLHFYF
jgi:hypothetical protein